MCFENAAGIRLGEVDPLCDSPIEVALLDGFAFKKNFLGGGITFVALPESAVWTLGAGQER